MPRDKCSTLDTVVGRHWQTIALCSHVTMAMTSVSKQSDG